MTQFDTQAATRKSPPDVFTVLLVVATLLLAVGVAWLYLVNSEHSKVDNRSDGGPLVLVD
jgi:hypothetical protein